MCNLTTAHSMVQTKESLQQKAVAAINEAARISPTSILTLLNMGKPQQLLANKRYSTARNRRHRQSNNRSYITPFRRSPQAKPK